MPKSGPKTPCPICGRIKDQSCSWNDKIVICWHGQTNKPPAMKIGETLRRGNADWAYVGEAENGMGAMFKIDEPLKTVETSWEYLDVHGKPATRKTRKQKGQKKDYYQKPLGDYDKVPNVSLIRPYGRIGEQTFIVEGEKTCDAVMGLGLDAITFISSKADPSTLLVKDGADYILCPDCDQVGLEWMERVESHVLSHGGQVAWLYAGYDWDRGEATGYDLADWIAEGVGVAGVMGAVGVKREISFDGTFWERIPKQTAKLEPHDLHALIVAHAGSAIRWNELTRRVEIDGVRQGDDEMRFAYVDFSARGIKLPKADAEDQLLMAAKVNSYHPIRSYLDGLKGKPGLSEWSAFARDYISPAATELDCILLRKWIVSAVARVYEPGCPADFIHILAGPGGTHKTSFYTALFSQKWFADSFNQDIKDKDALMTLHNVWGAELGEIDGLMTKRSSQDIKNFVTRKEDPIRVPYGRVIEDYPRSFVMCGTSNQDCGFLYDDTGNRRFVILKVDGVINVDRVIRDRDKIWASAVQDYLVWKPNRGWNMSELEQASNEAGNKGWMAEDVWQAPVAAYLSSTRPDTVLTSWLLEQRLGVDVGKQTNHDLTRVSRILTTLGYRRKRRVINGRKITVYERTESAEQLDIGGGQGALGSPYEVTDDE
jgi:predicted P-loop ATPase